MKLLVVDDQPTVGELISQVVRNADWESISTCHALDTVALVEEHHPDALMIDQFMPEESGLEIVAELRARGNQLPVILFSGNPEMIDPAEVARLHIGALLTKPVSVKQLQGMLKTLDAEEKASHP